MHGVEQVTDTRIIGITRLENTRDGGPRYLITTTDGVFRTKPDAADIYRITDSYAGRRVRLTWQWYYGYYQVYGIDLLDEQ